MSLRVSMSSWFSSACSGDMYSSVPTTEPSSVNSVLSVSFGPAALATPKSITFGTGRPSYRQTRTLEGQGLPLLLEAGDDLAAVHAGLDQLQGHPALDGLRLLGQEDGAHAALADLLQQLVRADHRSGAFGAGFIGGAKLAENGGCQFA